MTELQRAWATIEKYCQTMHDEHVLQEKIACAGSDPWTAVEHDWHAKWWLEAKGLFQELIKLEQWNSK